MFILDYLKIYYSDSDPSNLHLFDLDVAEVISVLLNI